MIKNMADLKNFVNERIAVALELTRDEIFKIVLHYCEEYYDEYLPNEYHRTYKLLHNCQKSEISKNGNEYSFWVGWNDNYLKFIYPGEDEVSGLWVLQEYNSGTHGTYLPFGKRGSNFWDLSITDIENQGGINNIFKKNCKLCGLNITN